MKVPPLSSPKAIAFLLVLTLAAGAAMLPALSTLSDDGNSITDIEFAGSAPKMEEIHTDMSADAKDALWVQLLIDVPFLIGYGLLVAAITLWCAQRAAAVGRLREAAWATKAAVLGPVGAGFDMAQNIALAIVNGGHTGQPWPRISEVGGRLIFVSIAIALIFAAIALVASLRRSGTAASPS